MIRVDSGGPESPPRLLAYLRNLPGRCSECGAHVAKQGHRGFCAKWTAETAINWQRGAVDATWAFMAAAVAALAFIVGTHPTECLIVLRGALHTVGIVLGLAAVLLVVLLAFGHRIGSDH